MFSRLGFDTHYLVLLLLLILLIIVRASHFYGITFSRLLSTFMTLYNIFDMCGDFAIYFINLANFDFSKRRSLMSANPTFSLFLAYFRYSEYISRFFLIIVTHYDIYDISIILSHIFHTISHIFHLQTTIPYTTNHSFSLFSVLSFTMPLSTITRLSGFIACINVCVLDMFWNPPLNHSHTQFLFKTIDKRISTYF